MSLGLNSENRRKPVIQTWTNKYQATLRVLYIMIRNPSRVFHFKPTDTREIYYDELVELGIFEEIKERTVKLNLKKLAAHSIIVDDELYMNMTDLNWVREQRKKLGMIKGRVKDKEFRRRQQERRKKRRAYAREQAAKYRAQPPEELPLAEVVFDEASLDSESSESK